jgi:hypothetical protein
MTHEPELDDLITMAAEQEGPEHDGRCPACDDLMDEKHDNLRPTWSDKHDDIVCWWCAYHS